MLLQGPVSVTFRNVFNVEAEYVYSIDNPAFMVGKLSEKLAPKKPVSISISYRPEAMLKAQASTIGKDSSRLSAPAVDAAAQPAAAVPKTGKLTISCPKQTTTQWVFYLQA
jgi:hydrocephalus-inducing protein